MGEDLIKKNDIVENFLVTAMYGTNHKEWPRETIAACKITCIDKDGKTWVSHQIYKNDPIRERTPSRHAEVKLIEYLRWLGNALVARRIIIEVYMNYSPCNKCSEAILKYIKEMKLLKRGIEMTITFANFYKTHEYTYKKSDGTMGGNSQEDADGNIKGINDLCAEPGMELQLFGRDVKWVTFLDVSKFFDLKGKEKEKCLEKANGKERKLREEFDKKFWKEKISEVKGVTEEFHRLEIKGGSGGGKSA